MSSEVLAKLGLYFIPFLFSLCVHEFSHGWVALKRGDSTAKLAGRLTLNPLAHADIVGTFLLPIIGIISGIPFFGWANPVPVSSRNLKNPRVDLFWIAIAGPASNVLMALIGALLLPLGYRMADQGNAAAGLILEVFVRINLALAFFNMIPIHPLDGGKVIARFLPTQWNQKLEMYQSQLSFLLLFLFISGMMNFLVIPIEWTYHLFKILAFRVWG